MMEPWIETYLGNKFSYVEDTIDDINLQDIINALSFQCRFTGQCRHFYSVAEHSAYVSDLLPKHKAVWGLLHDASEAYLSDIAKPAKILLKDYNKLEEFIMSRIARKFNLPVNFWKDDDVKLADWAQLKEEAKVLLPSGGKDWYWPETLPSGIVPKILVPENAYGTFLNRCYLYGLLS